MKYKFFISTAIGICAAFGATAENPATLEQNLNQPDADSIYVSRYGYWHDMPVKMAYFGCLGNKKLPDEFLLKNEQGKTVFKCKPQLMRTPGEVLAPVGKDFPGEKIYALNFSAFKTSGSYYIDLPGFGKSELFRIGGKMPLDIFPPPSLKTFEEQSHIINNNGKPIIQDGFLKTPLAYPIDTTP